MVIRHFHISFYLTLTITCRMDFICPIWQMNEPRVRQLSRGFKATLHAKGSFKVLNQARLTPKILTTLDYCLYLNTPLPEQLGITGIPEPVTGPWFSSWEPWKEGFPAQALMPSTSARSLLASVSSCE